MQKVVLKATKREALGKKVGALRRAGKVFFGAAPRRSRRLIGQFPYLTYYFIGKTTGGQAPGLFSRVGALSLPGKSPQRCAHLRGFCKTPHHNGLSF
jgi:hypothetical protein